MEAGEFPEVHGSLCLVCAAEKTTEALSQIRWKVRMDPHACCGMCTPSHTHTFVHRDKDYIHPHAGTPTLYTHMCVHTNIDCIHREREYFQIIQTQWIHREREIYICIHIEPSHHTHIHTCAHTDCTYIHTQHQTQICVHANTDCALTHTYTQSFRNTLKKGREFG